MLLNSPNLRKIHSSVGTCRKRLPEETHEMMRLEGLESDHLAALACQMLGVKKIPEQLGE